MTPDPSPERRPTPGRLWTDLREEDEHQPWLRPRPLPPTAQMAVAGPPPPPPRRRFLPVAIASLAALVLLAAGALGTSLLLRDGDEAPQVSKLPTAPGAVPADSRTKAIRAVAAAASPSVVSIRVQQGSTAAGGTGFVIDSSGTIVTNAHVVGTASKVQVQLDDNAKAIDADVVGADASSDLAVLKIDAGAASSLTPLVLADSDAIKAGDLAIAIGYPLGLDRTVTAGIVSGVGRAIQAPNGFQIDKVIQTDAPINPGNSGGPLLDGAGRVIGVNSQIATANGAGGNVGIGFAVPANTVREVVPKLQSGVTIRRAFLGVSTLGSTTRPGALVRKVVGGGPAEAGGVRLGDIITRVGDRPIGAPEDISSAIEERRPGDRLDIEVERGGAKKKLQVTLGTRPESSSPTGP